MSKYVFWNGEGWKWIDFSVEGYTKGSFVAEDVGEKWTSFQIFDQILWSYKTQMLLHLHQGAAVARA